MADETTDQFTSQPDDQTTPVAEPAVVETPELEPTSEPAPASEETDEVTAEVQADPTTDEVADPTTDEVVDATEFEPIDEAASEAGEAGTDAADNVHKAATTFADSARHAADVTSKTVTSGVEAIKAVSRAKREHADARGKLSSLQKDLADDQALLDHRTQIEQEYDQIIATQNGELSDANSALSAANDDEKTTTDQKTTLSEQLKKMREDNAAKLDPYKKLADTSRGRYDDAAKTLNEAKRALKAAESQLADATNRRDSRSSTAKRAVDNAEARLRRLQDELDRMQKDPATKANDLTQMRGEVASELAHLKTAKEDVVNSAEECQQAVSNAQTHQWTQQQSVETAQKAADAAKEESDKNKAEYDKMYQDATTQEATLDNQVVQCDMHLRDVKKAQDSANKRIEAAQAIIDEANDIHSTPEITQQVRDRIAQTQADIDEQTSTVQQLAQAEAGVRESTKQQRLVFIGAVVVVVLIILLVLWLVFGMGH